MADPARLQRLDLFASCTPKELKRLAGLLDETTVAAGTVLTEQGGLGSQAFVLLSGSADVLSGGRAIATLGAGDLIGEMALLDRAGARSATVVTTSEADVLVMDPQSFETVMSTFPTVARQVATTLARRLREAGQDD
ncbi:cyclic nucleotide-binding domain-containing protein [Nocardioides sp. TRM66260-LWL]|uniref:Crp/Fnr family transcriptional regulator n=1 Tax=Nocardioides sp. TRM66260-LWL TaxID=2874478 RepID=UPI001CC6BC68|nr:cyclic nucleotide-binding domain-containing protein [Nocardioides sp. TRM66260-LWL]MBZ5735483.1 cyclic nucleotide-binding domain-containing protein [Nocardioides sp. TRM66260-LWL]